MPLPPGLLPDSDEPTSSRTPIFLGIAVFACLLGLAGALVQNRRLAAERDDALDKLTKVRVQVVEKSAVPAVTPEPPAALPTVKTPVREEPAEAPVRAPDVRVLKDKGEDAQYITRGLHEFRSARYDQAERQFFRAFPDSALYLALTGLAQKNWREAFAFLSRAMALDPKWLHRVNPRDLFGTEADYEALLQSLDEQVSKNPLDSDLKVLSAYLRFHDKGAPYAKALLVEATNAHPDHEAAKAFLEALGP